MITKVMIDIAIRVALEKLVDRHNEEYESEVGFERVDEFVYIIDGGYQYGAYDINVSVDEL